MTTSLYPDVIEGKNTKETLDNIVELLYEVVRLRDQEDISDFNNLPQRFVRGRGLFESRLAPTSPTDVLATDQEGDIVNDNTYEYKLLNISGSGLLWDRRTLDVTW